MWLTYRQPEQRIHHSTHNIHFKQEKHLLSAEYVVDVEWLLLLLHSLHSTQFS